MAFSASNLYNITGMPPGFAQYYYKSDTDDREDVMASGYFNNSDDNQNFAADDTIQVVGDEGGYLLRVDTVSAAGVVTTELGGQSIWVGRQFDDIAGTGSHYVIAPCDGVIRRMKAVNETVVTDACILGLELATVNVTDGASASIVTIAASDAAGTVNVGEADTANAVSEGDAVEITSDGGGSGTIQAFVLVEFIPA